MIQTMKPEDPKAVLHRIVSSHDVRGGFPAGFAKPVKYWTEPVVGMCWVFDDMQTSRVTSVREERKCGARVVTIETKNTLYVLVVQE